MKGRRLLKAAALAAFYVLPVAAASGAFLLAESQPMRIALGVAIVIAVVMGLRAATIYVPGFDLLGRIPWRGPRRGRRIAITFDDGPNGRYTEQVLELFARYGGRATFFMVGQAVKRYPELARAAAAQGHAVGSHTYTHAKLGRLPRREALEQIELGRECLAAAGVPEQHLFRAPHGQKTFGLVSELRRRGVRIVAWTHGVFDTDCADGDVIARRARRKLRPGEILLLHDGKIGQDRTPMLEALEQILVACRQRNLEPVTIPELLGWSPAATSAAVRREAGGLVDRRA